MIDAPGETKCKEGCPAAFGAGEVVGIAQIHIPEAIRTLDLLQCCSHLLEDRHICRTLRIAGRQYIKDLYHVHHCPAVASRPVDIRSDIVMIAPPEAR